MAGGIKKSGPTKRSAVLAPLAQRAAHPSRSTNKLTDREIKAFIVRARAGTGTQTKISDGGGLYLTVTPAGSGTWRLKYRLAGKERLYSIGVYPGIPLEGARAEREALKTHIRSGRDPVKERQLSRATASAAAGTTFANATDDWLARRKKDWSKIHYDKSRRALERDILPLLGNLPIGSITPSMIAGAIEKVMKRGAVDTASKTLWHVEGVFKLAQAKGLCRDNPAMPVREVLPRKKDHSQRPAIVNFEGLGDLLRRAEIAPLSPPVRIAHRLCAFSAARIGNVIAAEWPEFELDSDMPSWTIPRSKMKMRDRPRDHRVFLGPIIAGELRTWRATIGDRGYLFPSPTGKGGHITHESLEKAYRVTLKMEGKHSPHGWRSSLSTLARDAGFGRDVVELALDHVHDTAVARAYDRGDRLVERLRLVKWWDAELTRAQSGAKIVSLKSAAS